MMKQISPASASRTSDFTATGAIRKACEAAFGRPLVVNNPRAILVECMVAEALAPRWEWVSADWAGWDFQNADGIKLEVKQSAAKQTWPTNPGAPSKCVFDIAARTGYWVGSEWVVKPGRNADIFIFAHHPIMDMTADHREPMQWHFYVVKEGALPVAGRKTISLSRVKQMTGPVGIEGLSHRVHDAEMGIVTSGSCHISRSVSDG